VVVIVVRIVPGPFGEHPLASISPGSRRPRLVLIVPAYPSSVHIDFVHYLEKVGILFLVDDGGKAGVVGVLATDQGLPPGVGVVYQLEAVLPYLGPVISAYRFGTVTQFASPRFDVGSVAGLAAVSGPGVGALPPAGLGAGAAGGGAGGPAAPARPAAVHLCSPGHVEASKTVMIICLEPKEKSVAVNSDRGLARRSAHTCCTLRYLPLAAGVAVESEVGGGGARLLPAVPPHLHIVLSALVSTVWIDGLRIVYFHEVVGAASADPVRGLGGELREGDIQVLRPRHLHRKYLDEVIRVVSAVSALIAKVLRGECTGRLL